MREIKFRGKRVDDGEWVYGYLSKGRLQGFKENSLQPCIDREEKGVMVSSVVMLSTVGQCTGLADKNGHDIYEGDICRDSLGWIFEVVWDSDNGRFLGRHSKPRGDTYICYVGRIPSVEVIGNVFDSPELLNT